ncbi:MAG TPA: tetratricopeptide repeat protein [Victivallales bacterium]|nr:tetratricopeptide repeat protein [Victivallales bacterium]
MAENEQEKFSFESAPDKIGGETDKKDGAEFSFDEVPILGNKGKASSIVDLLGGASSPPKKKRPQSEQGADESGGTDSSGQSEQSAGSQEDLFATDSGEWLNAAPKKKKLNKKLIIIAASVFALAILTAITAFFLLRGKEEEVKNADGVVEKRRLTKEEKEKIRLEAEAKKFEEAVVASEKLITDGEYAKAETSINALIASHPEKSILYTLLARSQLRRKQSDLYVENYIKAISAGAMSAEPYSELCVFYLSAQKKTEALDMVEKGLKKFPEDQSLLRASASVYLAVDDKAKAVEVFGKIDKTELSQKEISDYADALRAIGENKKAREIYVYAGKKFIDSKAFEKALEVEPDPIEKSTIINTAITIFEKDSHKKNKMLMFLIRDLFKTGRKDMAMEKMKVLDIEFLSPADSLFYLEKTLETSSDIIIKDKIDSVIAANSKNFDMMKGIQKILFKNGKESLSAEIFSELWTKNPEVPEFEYFYARSIDPLEAAIGYYSSAVKKKPDFQDALVDLGALLIYHRRYSEAESVLLKARKINPDDPTINRNLFLSRFYVSRNTKALDEYKKFLQAKGARGIPETLIEYAQMLDNPLTSETLISEMEKSKSRQFWRIRHDVVYWKDPGRHFSEYYPLEARELNMIYLISNGKLKDVLMLSTPPEKFPDFWKVFIMWRSNLEGWEEMATKFYEKNKADSSYNMISLLMLGKYDPEEARKQVYRIKQELEPLFYLVVAEQYRKAGLSVKAKVCYSKALGEGPNIYRKAVQYFENN